MATIDPVIMLMWLGARELAEGLRPWKVKLWILTEGKRLGHDKRQVVDSGKWQHFGETRDQKSASTRRWATTLRASADSA